MSYCFQRKPKWVPTREKMPKCWPWCKPICRDDSIPRIDSNNISIQQNENEISSSRDEGTKNVETNEIASSSRDQVSFQRVDLDLIPCVESDNDSIPQSDRNEISQYSDEIQRIDSDLRREFNEKIKALELNSKCCICRKSFNSDSEIMFMECNHFFHKHCYEKQHECCNFSIASTISHDNFQINEFTKELDLAREYKLKARNPKFFADYEKIMLETVIDFYALFEKYSKEVAELKNKYLN